MVRGQSNSVIQYLYRLAGKPAGGDRSDADLLRRFSLHNDQYAFAAIVEKHGSMVWGVCRRVLRNVQDAEDAFQATFFVLVRKAGSLRQPDSLASWLYGVAYRTAIKARAIAAQRRFHETQAMSIQASRSGQEPIGADLKELLDEEVNRLPAKYRQPFILCYLTGKTNEEAARELSCAPGTIFSRLSRAREMLRSRLTRRGIFLSAAGLATAMSEAVGQAAVPSALAEATIRSAFMVGAGKALTIGATSASVFTLTKGVQQAMFMNTLKIILAVGVVGTVVFGGTVVAYLSLAHNPSEDEKLLAKQANASNVKPNKPRNEKNKNVDNEKRLAEEKKKLDAELNITRMLKEQAELTRGEVEARMQQFDAGKGTLVFLFDASKRLLLTEEAIRKNKEDITPLKAHFERMKKIQDTIQTRFDDGRMGIEDLYQAKYYRLEAEIWLERAKMGEWKPER